MSEHTKLIDRLINLRDEELLYVLQNVFAHRTPNPEEAEYNRNKYDACLLERQTCYMSSVR